MAQVTCVADHVRDRRIEIGFERKGGVRVTVSQSALVAIGVEADAAVLRGTTVTDALAPHDVVGPHWPPSQHSHSRWRTRRGSG